MQHFKVLGSLLVILFLFATSAHAQDYVYTAKNPAFGGSYMNYQWMLSSANAQNKLKSKSQPSYGGAYNRDPAQNFEQNLERRFFSQLSSEIINSYFGEGQEGQQLEEGSYRFGNYEVDVIGGDRGLNIRIEDFRQGSETTITLPYY